MTDRGPLLPDISLHWNISPIKNGATVRFINETSALYRKTGRVIDQTANGRTLTVEYAEPGGGVVRYAVERRNIALTKTKVTT